MPKYRIIKIEDRQKTYFRIEKKFLFWWFNCLITEKYFEYHGMALITKRDYDYYSLEQAEGILDKIKNPFTIKYKGNKIVRVFGDNMEGLRRLHLRDVYINKSNPDSWKGHSCYEFSETLDGLKSIIDNRTGKKKITVIS